MHCESCRLRLAPWLARICSRISSHRYLAPNDSPPPSLVHIILHGSLPGSGSHPSCTSPVPAACARTCPAQRSPEARTGRSGYTGCLHQRKLGGWLVRYISCTVFQRLTSCLSCKPAKTSIATNSPNPSYDRPYLNKPNQTKQHQTGFPFNIRILA